MGIALAAALMTVVAAFGTSLLHFLVISAENKYGDWHVSFDAVDTAFVQAQAQDPQVAHTAVLENLGYATLEGGQSPEKPYLFLAGLPAASWDTLPIRLLYDYLERHQFPRVRMNMTDITIKFRGNV